MTGPKGSANIRDIEHFINCIQDINYYLPLRIIPLKIVEFKATLTRMNGIYREALEEQYKAYDIWVNILRKYYNEKEINSPYEEILLRRG